MPWYNDLRPETDKRKQEFGQTFTDLDNDGRIRIIESLQDLRLSLNNEIPERSADKNILIATWNIREFGHYSKRIPDSYFIIAEIINRFDLVAVQEIKSSLRDLHKVMRLLGSDWDYLVNDITDSDGGNNESFAYIFNSKRVKPTGLAGEIVLGSDIARVSNISQLMRTPYITGFKAGWKEFAIINVHLKASKGKEEVAIRKSEVTALVSIIEKRIKRNTLWTQNLMIMGDFNIYYKDTEIMKIISDKGFLQLQSVEGIPTTVSGKEAYDKIFYLRNEYFNLAGDDHSAGGVFNFFDSIMTMDNDDWKKYKKDMNAARGDKKKMRTNAEFIKYFKIHWRTRQISDHLPLWISLQIDHTDEFLDEKLNQNRKE